METWIQLISDMVLWNRYAITFLIVWNLALTFVVIWAVIILLIKNKLNNK